MIQYASRRKAKFVSFKSFKLDDIGELEAGVKKLDYHHITTNIAELPWLDFKTFVLYNIMDVIVQKCIEVKTQDLEYIFAKCVLNNTSYKKGHRQTVYLINRMASEWYKMGYIIGNNCNKDNPKGDKFLGALVGNPDNTNDYSKMKIDGRAILVCENLNDYDFKSLYPSIMGEFNIAPNTQIGKINISETVYDGENAYHIPEEKYSRGGEFIENLVTDSYVEYCHRWFHLADIQEAIEDIDEYFSKYSIGAYSNIATVFSPIIPTVSKARNAVSHTESRSIKSVRFCDERPKEYTYFNLIEEAKNR
jgi:DNA polymerase elongation subunit (family B)